MRVLDLLFPCRREARELRLQNNCYAEQLRAADIALGDYQRAVALLEERLKTANIVLSDLKVALNLLEEDRDHWKAVATGSMNLQQAERD